MRIFRVLLHAVLFTLAVVLLAIPEARSDTLRAVILALIVIDGTQYVRALFKAGLMVDTTFSRLYHVNRTNPESVPTVSLLNCAATVFGAVALTVTSF